MLEMEESSGLNVRGVEAGTAPGNGVALGMQILGSSWFYFPGLICRIQGQILSICVLEM